MVMAVFNLTKLIIYLSTEENFGHSNILCNFDFVTGILDFHW